MKGKKRLIRSKDRVPLSWRPSCVGNQVRSQSPKLPWVLHGDLGERRWADIGCNSEVWYPFCMSLEPCLLLERIWTNVEWKLEIIDSCPKSVFSGLHIWKWVNQQIWWCVDSHMHLWQFVKLKNGDKCVQGSWSTFGRNAIDWNSVSIPSTGHVSSSCACPWAGIKFVCDTLRSNEKFVSWVLFSLHHCCFLVSIYRCNGLL
jgi:hypothetical protein